MSAKDEFRLVRRALGWQLAPVDVLRLVREDAHPVALSGTWAGGSDLVAAEPVLVRSAPGPLHDVLDAPWPAGASDTAGAPDGADTAGGADGPNTAGEAGEADGADGAGAADAATRAPAGGS